MSVLGGRGRKQRPPPEARVTALAAGATGRVRAVPAQPGRKALSMMEQTVPVQGQAVPAVPLDKMGQEQQVLEALPR